MDVLCGQPNYPFGQFFKGYRTFGQKSGRRGGVRIFRSMEIKRDTGSALRVILNYMSFSIASRFRAHSLLKHRYDAVLVYQTSPVMQMAAAERVARRQHIPLVTYAVDIWPQSIYTELDLQNFVLRKMFDRISARHYLRSDRVIVTNQQAEKYFTGTLKIHSNKVFCVPPGQDARFDSEVREMHIMERYAGSFNFLITDELLKTQDYDTIFEAGRLLLNAGISDIRFIVTGSGRKLASLKKKVDRMGLHDMVFFEEVRDAEEMPKYFYVANALLSYKKLDAVSELDFPEMFADFMSQGKPILTGTGGMEKSLVRDAGCGLTCDPQDPKGLFDIIMRIYRCPLDELRQMGEQAAIYHKMHFDRQSNIDRIVDILFRHEDDTDDGFTINQNTHIIKTEDI